MSSPISPAIEEELRLLLSQFAKGLFAKDPVFPLSVFR